MRLSRALAVVERQLYLMRGSPARVVPLFGFVVIDIVLWGFITRYLDTVSTGINFVTSLLGAVVLWGFTTRYLNSFTQFNFAAVFLGAMLLWDFLTRVMHGVTMAFLEDVWSRNFLNIFATPMSIAEYLAGLVLSSVATSSLALVVMLLVATLGFGLSFLLYGAMLVPFFLVLFLCGIALGIVGTAIVLRLGPAAEWFIWPVPAMLSPFVGVLYPLATLPPWMRIISYILPPSYVFEAMRAVISGGRPSLQSLLLAVSFSIMYILLACWFFQRTYRLAVNTGLIPRYSAESVS
jgi:ABC-2 type transport system permease protein